MKEVLRQFFTQLARVLRTFFQTPAGNTTLIAVVVGLFTLVIEKAPWLLWSKLSTLAMASLVLLTHVFHPKRRYWVVYWSLFATFSTVNLGPHIDAVVTSPTWFVKFFSARPHWSFNFGLIALMALTLMLDQKERSVKDARTRCPD